MVLSCFSVSVLFSGTGTGVGRFNWRAASGECAQHPFESS